VISNCFKSSTVAAKDEAASDPNSKTPRANENARLTAVLLFTSLD
jgi:hypothetical protein